METTTLNQRSGSKILQEGPTVHSFLGLLGDCSRLGRFVETSQTIVELKPFENLWRPYNVSRPHNRREGLPLISMGGELDHPAQLEPIGEFNKINKTNLCDADFSVPTEIMTGLPSLHPILKLFPTLGRTNLIRLNSGGFFPPHRDLDFRTFRIIVPIANCSNENFFFHVGDQRRTFEPGWPYVINIRQVHSVFSFKDGAVFLLMNIPSTRENLSIVTNCLSPS